MTLQRDLPEFLRAVLAMLRRDRFQRDDSPIAAEHPIGQSGSGQQLAKREMGWHRFTYRIILSTFNKFCRSADLEACLFSKFCKSLRKRLSWNVYKSNFLNSG